MTAATTHPPPDVIAAYAHGRLSEEESVAFEAHLAGCEACSRLLHQQPEDPLLRLLRRPQGSAPPRPVRPSLTTGNGQGTAPGKDAADVPDVPAELIGHPRYRVLGVLGQGGMGAVYLAEHLKMGRRVALKVIRPALLERPDALPRFEQEARAAARLAHANIVQAFDADQAGGLHFLVMEYVEGTDLARRLEQGGPLPAAQACEVVRQAALGLQHAHERGMVHRDVKPHNLMLTPEGRVKILDFGLARFAQDQAAEDQAVAASPGQETDVGLTSQLTGTGMALGTADYVAPEQTRDGRRSDIRSDVYSLGCTLYHLLSGRVPFAQGAGAVDKMLRHSLDSPPSLASLRPELPAGLVAVVERMMAKEPAQRPQTPAEVAAALAPYARDGAKPAPKARRRWPALTVALAAMAVAAVLLAAVYRIQTDQGELVIRTDSDDVEVAIKEGGRVVRVIDTKTDKEIRLSLHSGVYELELQGAPEGLKLSLGKVTLTRGKTELARIERLPPPDGVAEATTLRPLHRIEWGAGRQFGVVDVSPDGSHFLATRSGEEHARIWETTSGRLVQEIPGALVARFTPDGKQVVAHSWNPDDDFHVHELDTGKVVGQFGERVQTWNFLLSGSGSRLFNITPDGRQVWDWSSGKKLCDVPSAADEQTVIMPEGRSLLRQPGGQPPLVVYDVDTGKEEESGRLRNVPKLVNVSSDGKRLLCIDGSVLRVFDVASGREIRSLERGTGCWGLLVGDGRRMLANLQPDAVGLWDVDAGRLIAKLQFPETVAKHLRDYRASADGSVAAFGVNPDVLYVFRLPEGSAAPAKPTPEPAREVLRIPWGPARSSNWGVDLSPDGCLLISMHWNGARVWDVSTGKLLYELPESSLARFTPDGKQIVGCSRPDADRNCLQLYDSQSGKPLRRFGRHPEGAGAGGEGAGLNLFPCPDGRTVLTSSWTGPVDGRSRWLWDLTTGEEIKLDSDPGEWYLDEKIGGSRGLVEFVKRRQKEDPTFSPECVLPGGREVMGRPLVDGKAFAIYEIGAGRVVRTIPLEGVGRVGENWLSTSRGRDRCRRQAVAFPDGSIHVLDLVTGQDVARFSAGNFQPKCLVISADGRFVAACASNEKSDVVVWRLPDPGAARGEEVGEVRQFVGHTQRIYPVAFSPDGRLILTGACGGEKEALPCAVQLWDAITGKEVGRLTGPESGIFSATFSADGKRVVAGCAWPDPSVWVWDVESGKVIQSFHRLVFAPGHVYGVAISPDGRHVFSGDGATVRMWDVETGKEVKRFDEEDEPGVCCLALSRDGRSLVGGGGVQGKSNLRVWDVETGKEVARFPGHAEGGERSVAISPDGGRILSGGYDGTVRLWDVRTGKEVRRFEGNPGTVYGVTFSPDGNRVLSGGTNREVRLWAAETGKELHRFTGHTAGVMGVAFSPDGRFGVSGSFDNTARLWRLPEPSSGVDSPAQGEEVRRFRWGDPQKIHDVPVVDFSPDGQTLLVAGNHNPGRLFDLRTGELLRELDTESLAFFTADGSVVAMMWDWLRFLDPDTRKVLTETPRGARQYWNLWISPTRRHALTWDAENAYQLWDLTSGKELHRWGGADWDGRGWWSASRFTGDGKYLVLGVEGSIRLWDIAAGKETVRKWETVPSGFFQSSFRPGDREVVVCHDGALHFHDAMTGAVLRRVDLGSDLGGGSQGCYGAISPDGRLFLTPAVDGSLRLWDLKAGRELRRYPDVVRGDHAGIRFSPDGRLAAIGQPGVATVVRLPDVEAAAPAPGGEIRVLQRVGIPGNPSYYQLAVSPDGKFFAADLQWGGRTTAVVWDGQTGKELHSFPTWTPGFSPDGKRLFVLNANDKGSLTVYDPATGKNLATYPGPFTAYCPLGDSRHLLGWRETKGEPRVFDLIDLETEKVIQSWNVAADLPWVATPDGRVLLVRLAGEESYRAWDVAKDRPSEEFAAIAKFRRIRAILPGNKQAVVKDGEEDNVIVDVADGKRVGRLPELPYPLSTGARSRLDFYTEGGGALLGYLKGVGEVVNGSRAALDYRVVLHCDRDGTLRLFDAEGKERASLPLPGGETLYGYGGMVFLTPDARHACVATPRAVYLLALPDVMTPLKGP